MGLYERAVDPLRVVFLQKEGQYAGFIVYVTYHSEDGKCFILEYCIDRTRRGKGLGAAFFQAFEERMRLEGATYIALNTSNAHNRRFWLAQGFAVGDADEYGNPVYTKRL